MTTFSVLQRKGHVFARRDVTGLTMRIVITVGEQKKSNNSNARTVHDPLGYDETCHDDEAILAYNPPRRAQWQC